MDEALRGLCERLAAGMFPLAGWIAQKSYRPPEGELPWRPRHKPPTLEPTDLGALTFFEEQLDGTEANDALAARFREVAADPLKACPIDHVADWRAQRGLAPRAAFGVVASGNMLADAGGVPATQAQFYAPYWPPLRQTVAAGKPQSQADWETLAKQLISDSCPTWPSGQPLKSSVFARQFARDIAAAMLNQRNPAPAPMRYALLIELGERRRVGNAFTPRDAQVAVQAFVRRSKS